MKLLLSISLVLPGILFSQTLDESFDPTSLSDWQPAKGYLEQVKPLREYLAEQQSSADSVSTNELHDFVFRVQLGSTTDYDEALAFEETAAGTFDDELVIQFDSPYYKIRVGKMNNREDAQSLQEFAFKNGYRRSWVIRTQNTAVNK